MQSPLLTKEESRMRVPREERREGRKALRVGSVGDQQAETKWGNGAEMGKLWDRYGGPKSISPPFILGSNTSEHRAELISSTTPHLNVPQNKGGNSLRVLV